MAEQLTAVFHKQIILWPCSHMKVSSWQTSCLSNQKSCMLTFTVNQIRFTVTVTLKNELFSSSIQINPKGDQHMEHVLIFHFRMKYGSRHNSILLTLILTQKWLAISRIFRCLWKIGGKCEFSNYINDRSFLLSTFFPAFVQLHADIAFNEDPFLWNFFNCTLKAFSLIGFMRFAHLKKHIWR